MVETEMPREQLTGGRVRGFLALARVKWVCNYFGERVLARVLAAMPPGAAADVTHAGIAGWCQFETLLLLDAALVEVCGREARPLLHDLGRYAAHLSIGPVASRDGLHRFLRSAALRDALFQEGARGTYDETSPTGGRLTIVAAPCFSTAWCRGAAGYLEQVIEIHGGTAVRVAETSCRAAGDESCVFDLRWR